MRAVQIPLRGRALFPNERVGVREVQITDSNTFGGAPRASFAVLHSDGSAFVAAAFWAGSDDFFGDGTDVVQISRDSMTVYVLGLMDLALFAKEYQDHGGEMPWR